MAECNLFDQIVPKDSFEQQPLDTVGNTHTIDLPSVPVILFLIFVFIKHFELSENLLKMTNKELHRN